MWLAGGPHLQWHTRPRNSAACDQGRQDEETQHRSLEAVNSPCLPQFTHLTIRTVRVHLPELLIMSPLMIPWTAAARHTPQGGGPHEYRWMVPRVIT